MANEDLKTLSITDIVRMRESASQDLNKSVEETTESNDTSLKVAEDKKAPEMNNSKPGVKNPTGETGDLYLKGTKMAKDINLNVAGGVAKVKISAEQMNEFLARTSHNNLGELTENDRKIVENMELGIHTSSTDDLESLKLGQDAIAGMIKNSKKIIDKQDKNIISEDKEDVEYPSSQTPENIKNEEDEDEDIDYPIEQDENMFDMDKYNDADTDDEVVVHNPKEKTAEPTIYEYMKAQRKDKSEDEDKPIVIDEFKPGNTGVAEIKANTFEDGLRNIKIMPFNGKKIVKQRLNTQVNSKKTPICALSSNIFCEVSGFSYSDLTQLNAERNDTYIDRRRQLEVLFKKILNPNVPLNFNTFLRTTSIYDEEAFYFGAFKSTFGDKVKIPLTCQNPKCKHSFTYEIDADDLIVSRDYITMGDKVKDIMSMHNIKDLEESDVNKIKRVRLSSGHIIDICHPSLYTLLEKTIKLVSNSDLAVNPKYSDIIDLLPFISALYVPIMPEGDTRLPSQVSPEELNYIEISIDEEDKMKTARTKLTALCDEILMLGYDSVMEISKFIMDRVTSIQEQFSMGLVDVVCPVCGQPLGAKSNGFENFIPIKIRELIFLNQLHQINEVSTK